jgi:hypothetical protein
MLYAGNSLAWARSVFERAIKHRPLIRLTIRSERGFRSVAAEMKGDRALVNPASAWDL